MNATATATTNKKVYDKRFLLYTGTNRTNRWAKQKANKTGSTVLNVVSKQCGIGICKKKKKKQEATINEELLLAEQQDGCFVAANEIWSFFFFLFFALSDNVFYLPARLHSMRGSCVKNKFGVGLHICAGLHNCPRKKQQSVRNQPKIHYNNYLNCYFLQYKLFSNTFLDHTFKFPLPHYHFQTQLFPNKDSTWIIF